MYEARSLISYIYYICNTYIYVRVYELTYFLCVKFDTFRVPIPTCICMKLYLACLCKVTYMMCEWACECTCRMYTPFSAALGSAPRQKEKKCSIKITLKAVPTVSFRLLSAFWLRRVWFITVTKDVVSRISTERYMNDNSIWPLRRIFLGWVLYPTVISYSKSLEQRTCVKSWLLVKRKFVLIISISWFTFLK